MQVLTVFTAVTNMMLLWLKLTVENALSRKAVVEERYIFPYKGQGPHDCAQLSVFAKPPPSFSCLNYQVTLCCPS